jgi:hypothetical protein
MKQFEIEVEVVVRRTVYVDADYDFTAKELAKKEVVNLLGGYEPQVLNIEEIKDNG